MKKKQPNIHKKVLASLNKYASDNELLVRELEELISEDSNFVYPIIFHLLTESDPSKENMRDVWRKIMADYESMHQDQKERIGLKTAICQYFCSVVKSFDNLTVIDARHYKKTVELSRTDYLTGLNNRRIFQEILEMEIARAERYRGELSVLFFDLDNFKSVNDQLGHAVGDKVLQRIAKTILQNKRQEDIAARYGGEEFVLLLPETGKSKALVIAERIRREIQKLSFEDTGKIIKQTTSCGLAAFPYDAITSDDLLQRADRALYRAKAMGKNTVSMFSQNMRRYVRVPFHGTVRTYELGEKSAVVHTATAVNIGGGGLLFENNSLYTPGATMQVKLSLRPQHPLTITGRIIRSDRQKKGNHQSAISFLEMNRKTTGEIFGFIMHYINALEDGMDNHSP